MNACPVLVGRDRELAELRAVLETGGGMALVSGEAGIGKSRLVREFAAAAEKRGRAVLWGRPEEVAQPGPYALVVDLLEALRERCAPAAAAEARDLVAELLRPAASDGEVPALSSRSIAARLRGLLSQLDAPPVVALEDLHTADEASHAVVLHLARSAADDGHVLIGTYRPEAVSQSVSLGRVLAALVRERIAHEVSLSPLAREEMAAMLEALWGRPPYPGELAAIERLGEGIPFFVEELAASEAAGQAPAVPRSIEQGVLARVRALGEEAATVLATASLVAGALDPAVIAIACDVPADAAARHLVEAVRAGLVADHEGKLAFRHGLVRDAIAASLVSLEAARIHGRLGRAIEAVHADELDLHATALARHYREAGDREQAVRYALLAGERALAAAATEEARTAFEQARDLSGGGSIPALRGLAEVELREGREREAAALFRAAIDALLHAGERVEAARTLGRLAWALNRGGDSAGAAAGLDEALALLADLRHSQDYARLMVRKGGMLAFDLNRHDEATPILAEGAEIARRLGDQALLAEALDGLAQGAERRGALREAGELGAEAIRMASESGRPETIGRTHNNYALALASHGFPREALAVVAAGRDHLRRAYGRAAVGALDVTHAWIARLMGLPNEVAALTARGQVAWHRWRGYRRVLEVWAALERNEVPRARSIVAATWEEVGGEANRRAWIADPAGPNQDASLSLLCEAILRLADGPAEVAVEVTSALVAFDRPGGDAFDLEQGLVLLARAQVLAGGRAEAEAALAELDALRATHPYPYLRAIGSEARGMIALAAGDPGRAAGHFREAASGFEGCSNVSDRARCERLVAETVLGADGTAGRTEAEERLRRALDLAQGSGALVEANRAEAVLRSLGIRPRAGRPRRGAPRAAGGLSPREAEVAVLVADGATNAEIARRLFLSERTVQDHITHVLRKLRLPGRAALATWAVKQGMI